MEIVIGSMRVEEEMTKKTNPEVSEQHKEASGERTEPQKTKTQQETAYNMVSTDGDTLSISEVGKAAIQKEAEENEQNNNASVVNLSTYTESELKQMYLDGDITKAEYDEEISSRETDKEPVPLN